MKREGREKFKEKLKRQRLKGQSGIGDHFRVWRSEEDMILRQQYQYSGLLTKRRIYLNTSKESIHKQE